MLTYTVGLLWPLLGEHYTVLQALANMTMLQGFSQVQPIDGVYWTLNAELCFYAVMLALFGAGLLTNTVRLSLIWLAAAAGSHLAWYLGIEVPPPIHQIFVLAYAELFVAGINFYEIYAKGPSIIRAILLVACWCVHLLNYGIGSAEHILVIFGAVAAAVSGHVRFLCVRPLIWLGTISYSLHLTHLIGFAVIRSLYQHRISSEIAIPITIISALALASKMTYFIERPAERAIRSRRKAMAVTVGPPF